MKFYSKEHLDTYLNNITFLGQGQQGCCYLNNNEVIKIFHEYYDEEVNYSKEEILKHSNIKNNTFIWPSDIVTLNDKIIGYTMPYINYKNLYRINPLKVNLNSLKQAIIKAYKDIEILTRNNVAIYDIMYNILYRNGTIKVIDTMDYGNNPSSIYSNTRGLDLEIIKFLVDNYFDNFVNNNKLLNELYNDKNTSSIIFIEILKNELSNVLQKEVITLNDAKSLVRKKKYPEYERELTF